MVAGCELTLLICNVALCLIAYVLTVVSFSTDYWAKASGESYSYSASAHIGLWKACGTSSTYRGSSSECVNLIDVDGLDGRIRAAQGAGILVLITGFCTCLFLCIFVFLRNTAMKVCTTVFAGLSALFATVCFATAGAWIIDELQSDWLDYSFGLMVAAFVLYLALFVLSFFLPLKAVRTSSRPKVPPQAGAAV